MASRVREFLSVTAAVLFICLTGCQSVVSGQQINGVTLQLQGVTIPNNSLVDINDLLYRTGFDPEPTNANGLHNQTLVCVTDLVDCCDSPRTVRGDWYYSNGNVVTYTSQIYGMRFVKNRGPNEIINGRQFSGSVRLFYRWSNPPGKGRFRCELPSASDPSINQILYANVVNFGINHLSKPVSISSSGSAIAEESYSLTCSATLVDPIPLPSNIPTPNFEWLFGPNGDASLPSGTALPVTIESENTFTSTLHFSILSQSNSGMYTCRLGAGSLSNSATINVQAPGNISVQINTSGSPVLGESSYTLTCCVFGAESINPFITYQWTKNNGTETHVQIQDGSNPRTISFDHLRVSDAGRYTCQARISSASLNNDIIWSVSHEVTILSLLDAPSNLMLSEAANQHMRLSWDEPFSLDITDVDSDVECYNVCYSLVSVTAEKSQCTCVNQREHTFLCVSVPLLFTVSAVNVVGEGEATSILHDGCSCTSTTVPHIVSPNEVVSFSLLDYNPMAKFLFQQLSEDRGTTCFLVYEVKTSLLLEANTTNHGVQIPRIIQYSQSSVYLSLNMDSDLLVNELYLTTITAINTDGERNTSVTVEFDTYDVQSVSGRVIPGGMELDCTFAEGSRAQSCILTVCRLENGMEEYCMNLTIVRENLQQSKQLTGLQPGLYTVKNVTEVESDSSVTLLRRTDELQLTIIEPPPTTAPTETISGDSTSAVGVSSSFVGPILGGVVAVLAMLLIASIIITVVTFAYYRQKLHHRNQETPQAAVYEEPYDWAVPRLPQTEPAMEQCPAYGVLTK